MGVFRLLLAFSVMTGHMGRSILGFHQLDGDIAVQCFYMISGFYMALILNEKYNRPHDYGVFLQQRFLRIYPSYFLIIAFTMLVEALFPRLGAFSCWDVWVLHGRTVTFFSGALYALANLFIFGQDWLYFFAVNPVTHALYFTPNFRLDPLPCYEFIFGGPSWTLGVELTFYLMAPFLVRRRISLQLAVFLASVALRFWLRQAFGFKGDPWHYRFFPTQVAFFMAGSLGYAFYRRHGPGLKKFGARFRWLPWLLWLVVFIFGRLPGTAGERAGVLLPVVGVMIPLLFALYRDNPWDRALGELSYPLYLIHPLVLFVLNPIRPGHLHPAAGWVSRLSPFYSAACLALALFAAWLFYHCIEFHIDRYRARLFRAEHAAKERRPPVPSGLGSEKK